jgi:hypothetical protein
MKTKIILAALILSATSLFAQTNLVTDGGFEAMSPTVKNYILNNSGTQKMQVFGKWFVSFSKGGCENGCCEGTSEITTAAKKSGNQALTLTIIRQTNRNDIKVFQVLKGITTGIYEVSFWAKSDIEGYPIALDVLKATQASTNNGAEPFTGNYTTSTEWKQFKLKVDLSSWAPEDLDLMRISIRPNNTKKLPEGPFPKTFWIDDVAVVAVQ